MQEPLTIRITARKPRVRGRGYPRRGVSFSFSIRVRSRTLEDNTSASRQGQRVKQINIKNVKRWITVSNNNLSHPVSVNTNCPKCHLSVVFATRRRTYDALRDTLACSAECPSCNIEIHFWMTNLMALTDDDEDNTPDLFMMPSSVSRMDLEQISDLLPDKVLQYCKSTQDVYQSGNLTATRVMAQSTLEAIFSSFLPAGNSITSLSRIAQDSLPSIDVNLPLTNLVASLRKGEHLDRLLHSTDPASHETAETLMVLVEKLVSFLYVEPTRFAELDQRLSELSRHLPAEQRQSAEPEPLES